MPTMAGRPCRFSGCSAVVAGGGYCSTHARIVRSRQAENDRRYNAHRPVSDQFYKTQAWREMARRVLREQPICALCRVKPSSIADHIKPLKLRPELAMVRENLRGVCHTCHNQYGARVSRPYV